MADMPIERITTKPMSVPSDLLLTEGALWVLRKRILLTDPAGNPRETPEEMFGRVSKEVARVERQYSGAQDVVRISDGFCRMMKSLDFLPNSPTLMNAGLPDGQLSACFVLPIEDSMESIFGTLRDMSLIQKTGGGTGFSFSRLRPRNDPIATSRGRSSGPVSFIRLYDHASEVTRLGGARRGANMAILRFDHPDILEFINAKRHPGSLRTFNLSVAVTDFFIESVKRSAEYPLINPRDNREVGRLNASQVFDAIVRSAWETGDPGLVFLDAINRYNSVPGLGPIEATNPCGEQPLLPYESCNLGSINVSHFVRNGEIAYEGLAPMVRLAVRFLDDVVDANRYPLPQIEKLTRSNRKIGLGVMGFADMLFLLGQPYDSEQAVATGEELMAFISKQAREESARLAEERGVFPNYGLSIFPAEGIRLRNAALTTVAPTGTISLIAGCSSGIEPVFAISYRRRVLENSQQFAIHPLFEKAAAAYLSERTRAAISETGTVQHLEEIPEDIRRVFVTAHDIEPEWHVRMQAAFQHSVDSAVSKTVNLRRTATPQDVERVYLLAHQLGCKGITIFRDGCKGEQVFTVGERKRLPASGAGACPECGSPMEHTSGCISCPVCGYAFCTI
jgi:ribonucleoside-diphosphate reductase alpha chain